MLTAGEEGDRASASWPAAESRLNCYSCGSAGWCRPERTAHLPLRRNSSAASCDDCELRESASPTEMKLGGKRALRYRPTAAVAESGSRMKSREPLYDHSSVRRNNQRKPCACAARVS